MRKLVVAVWLAVTSLVAAVPAASQVSLPPLAPGEVLLELSAVGTARTPATSATLLLNVRVEGESEEAARRALGAALRRVTATARAGGLAALDIEVTDRGVNSDPYPDSTLLNAAMVDFDVDMANSTVEPVSESAVLHGSATVNLSIRNPAGARDLQRRFAAMEGVDTSEPDFQLDDDSAARREARADALRRARADAEAYAASMNMRVARVLRVTERGGIDVMSLILGGRNEMLRSMEAAEPVTADGRILTYAAVGVDYALAPR
ncbi:MAG TPA: SIMPL domain-containing protein [Allosphingosinicella sp.]|jgi:hypothetical protein